MGELSRRGFLKFLTAASAAAAAFTIPEASKVLAAEMGLDPERALWTPGQKTIFLPEGKIAIKNVRLATDQEVGQLTGQKLLRVRHSGAYPLGREPKGWGDTLDGKVHRIDQVTVVSELEFQRHGHVAFDSVREIHFDNGTVAYFDGKTKVTLDAARADANRRQQEHTRRRIEREQFQRSFNRGRF